MKKNLFVRQIAAEFIGTMVFLTAIVGVNAGDVGPLAGLAAASSLGLMILLLGDVSGGHFNPAVSLFFFARKEITGRQFIGYLLGQLAGAVAGVALGAAIWNNASLLTVNNQGNGANVAEFISEVVATAGLVWLISKLARDGKGSLIAPVVAAWVFAAGTFTSTHAIANPAVVFGRFFTPVAGAQIQVGAGLSYIVAQVAGTLVALVLLTVVSGNGFAKGKGKKARKAAAKK